MTDPSPAPTKPMLTPDEEANLLKMILSDDDNLTAATRLLEIHYQSLERTVS